MLAATSGGGGVGLDSRNTTISTDTSLTLGGLAAADYTDDPRGSGVRAGRDAGDDSFESAPAAVAPGLDRRRVDKWIDGSGDYTDDD